MATLALIAYFMILEERVTTVFLQARLAVSHRAVGAVRLSLYAQTQFHKLECAHSVQMQIRATLTITIYRLNQNCTGFDRICRGHLLAKYNWTTTGQTVPSFKSLRSGFFLSFYHANIPDTSTHPHTCILTK